MTINHLKSMICMALMATMMVACATQNDQVELESKPMTKALAGTSWWVEDIDGKGVIDMSHTTIAFGEDGKVSGDTGCNRYFGGYESDAEGSGIQFGPLAGTLRACAPSLMDQEQKFYQAMENVHEWKIAETGLLYLLDEQGNAIIRAFESEE